MLLFAGFRSLIDELHAELARHGHPDVRPAYGFALQAVGGGADTATELGRRLGISKQAAGKTVDRLEALGYVERVEDRADARRRLVRLTPRGVDCLVRSAAVFDELHARWARTVGPERLAALEADLRTLNPGPVLRLDAPGWLGP